MSGENAGNEGTGAEGQGAEGGQGGEEGKAPPENKGFQPVTYKSQEELDAAFADRATRAADSAKKEALKAFEEAGATPDEAITAWKTWKAEEDKKKSPETLEREAHAKTARELEAYKNKEARDTLSKEVAKDLKIGEHPIPAELLAGTTKEEMTAHGQALIAFIQQLAGNGPRPPGYNPDQGHNQQDLVAAGDPIRNYMHTGSFQ